VSFMRTDVLRVISSKSEKDRRLPSRARRLAVLPDLVDQWAQFDGQRFVVCQVPRNVLSAPTDLRIRLARTGRSSIPREIQ